MMHDRTAEEYVLRVAIKARSLDLAPLLQEVDRLEADDFYHPKNAAVWRAICAVVRKDETVDAGSVILQLRDTGQLGAGLESDYIYALTANAQPESYRQLARHGDTIRAMAFRRRSVLACQLATEELGVRENSSEEIMERLVETQLHEIQAYRDGTKGAHVSDDLLETALERVDAGQPLYDPGDEKLVRTGYRDIDALLSGGKGLRSGDLAVLGALTSHGKTSFTIGLAINAIREGKRVLMISTELPPDQVLGRMVSYWTSGKVGIDQWLREGYEHTDQVRYLLETIQKSKSVIQQIKNATPQSVQTMLRSARVKGHEYDLCIIDFLNEMDPTPDSTTREANNHMRVTRIVRDLAGLAATEKLPILLCAQLNREGAHQDTPSLHHFRESGSIEEHATIGMVLHRPERNNPNAEKNMAIVKVAKNRNGPTAQVRLSFKPGGFRFDTYVPPTIPLNFRDPKERR